MRRAISIQVENRFGELSRIIGAFAARGCNIESLTVAEMSDPSVSHATVVTTGSDQMIEQIVKHLNRQVRVLEARDLKSCPCAEREIALVKVRAEIQPVLVEVLRLICSNNARLIEVSKDSLTLEATGDCQTVSDFVARLGRLRVRDVVRGGAVALAESPQTGAEDIVARSQVPAG